MLHEYAADRMTDQDRLLGKGADDRLEMGDDGALAGLRQFGPGRGAQLRRRAVVIRPVRRDHPIAPGLVARLEAFPALRIEPGAVDQHDRPGHRVFPSMARPASGPSPGKMPPRAEAAHSTLGKHPHTLV